jgi:hypothetical protein
VRTLPARNRSGAVPAYLLLLAACAHAPAAGRTVPDPPASSPVSSSSPAPAPPALAGADRFAPVRDAADALLAAQGEAAWRGWTAGEPADHSAPWKGKEALLDPALLGQLDTAIVTTPPPGRARLERLRAFVLGEQLGRAAAAPAQALATARAAATFGWERRSIPLRQLQSILAGEPEAPRRKAAAEAWRASVLKLEKLAEARDDALRRAGAERGFATTPAMAGALRLEDPERLAALAEATLAGGDASWPATVERLARAELGTSAARLRECDLPRIFRTTAPPESFPAVRLIPEVTAILSGLGLELSAGGRLSLDAAARPGKIPRPLAVPVEVPGQVRLSLTPLAGLDAVRAVLHEVGVGLSLAMVAPAAPFEDRRLQPAWHTEAWGLLFAGIASDPAWLEAHGLSPDAARREAGLEAARRTHLARAASATVLIELARARDPAGAAVRWAELGPRAFGHPLDRGDPLPWRLEPDPLLRSADALRALLLASRLSGKLAALSGGRPWWRSPEAGDWLRRAWADGAGGELAASGRRYQGRRDGPEGVPVEGTVAAAVASR